MQLMRHSVAKERPCVQAHLTGLTLIQPCMKLDPGTVNFRSLGHIHSSEPQPHQALFCKSEVVLLQGCSARRQSLLTVVVTGNNGDVHSFW